MFYLFFQISYQIGCYDICRHACDVLWNHFIAEKPPPEGSTYITSSEHDFKLTLMRYIMTYVLYSQISVIRTSIIRTTGLFEDYGQSRLFSILSIAIKLPIIPISIIRKIQFFEVIRRSRLKKMLLNYPSRFEVLMSRMVIMISLFGRVRFSHLSDLEKKVETGN